MNPLILQRTGHATPDASAPANGGAAPSAQAFEQILAALNAGGSAAQQHGAQGPTLALPATDQPRNPASGAPSLTRCSSTFRLPTLPCSARAVATRNARRIFQLGRAPFPRRGACPIAWRIRPELSCMEWTHRRPRRPKAHQPNRNNPPLHRRMLPKSVKRIAPPLLAHLSAVPQRIRPPPLRSSVPRAGRTARPRAPQRRNAQTLAAQMPAAPLPPRISPIARSLRSLAG